MDHAAAERRFLDGLAGAARIDRNLLDGPGTTVVGRDDRAGTGAVACYRAGPHLVVWADPAVVDRVTGLAGTGTVTDEELAGALGRAGLARHATVVTNLLAGPPAPPGALAPGHAQRWLDGDDPGTVDVVRAFTERCDPAEVDAAALDELEPFAEDAINVVTPDPDPDPPHIVAYASASAWDWDPVLADIGVLVHAEHRRRGLARFVVAGTVARLLADGRVPLYRHEVSNLGSASVAAGIGFRPVATLHYYVDRSAGPPSTGS